MNRQIASEQTSPDIRLEMVVREYSCIDTLQCSKAEKLCNAFIKTVEHGYWRPGERIPSEKRLTKLLPLSLGTVQKAMSKLVDKGIIVRRQGSGSRIADVVGMDGEALFINFYDDSDQLKLTVDIISTELFETTEKGPWSAFLNESSSYIRINRILSVQNDFCVSGQLHLDGSRFRPLLDYEPSIFGKLYICHILHDRFNTPLLYYNQSLSFVEFMDDIIASSLKVSPGSIGLQMEIFGYTFRDKPFLYQKFSIPQNDKKLRYSNRL